VGAGRMLDLGCGLGDGTVSFASDDRMLVGVDYDQETAASAVRCTPGRPATVCSDGAVLPLRTGAFDDVCSSHLIEHFTDPEHHVAEVARVLADDGRAFFLTPNKPADFENPYHVYLFDPEDLAAMLGRHFAQVTVLGLDATPR
jgi:SAM-dependent methyltransferase